VTIEIERPAVITMPVTGKSIASWLLRFALGRISLSNMIRGGGGDAPLPYRRPSHDDDVRHFAQPRCDPTTSKLAGGSSCRTVALNGGGRQGVHPGDLFEYARNEADIAFGAVATMADAERCCVGENPGVNVAIVGAVNL